MRNFLVIIVSAFLALSCQQKANDAIIPVNLSDTIVTEADSLKHENKRPNDTIYLNFIDDKDLHAVEGTIDSLHPRIYLKFENAEVGKLKAKIIPETGQGNIRFNQIIFPDGTADGPFSVDLDLELKQTGNHSLIIGHSLMADNPYTGKFSVELQFNDD